MEGRQYGIPPGYREGQTSRQQVSPSKVRSAYTRTNSPASAVVPPPSTVPPTHRPTPPTKAVPSAAVTAPSSSPKTRRRSAATPAKDFYSAAAAVGGLSGLAAHAAPPPTYNLRDIDNLYSSRMSSPSSEPKPVAEQSRPYTQAAPVFAVVPAATIPPSRPLHRPFDSQSSIAPLLENRGSPGARSRRSPEQRGEARRSPRKSPELASPQRSPNRSPPKRYRKNAFGLEDDGPPVSPVSCNSPVPVRTGPIAAYPAGFGESDSPVRASSPPPPLLRNDPRGSYSGSPAPRGRDSPISQRSMYQGDGYDEFIDPREIADDDDDGFGSPQAPKRRSRKSGISIGSVAAAGAGVAAAGGVFGRVFSGSRNHSGQYDTIPSGDGGGGGGDAEKSEWPPEEGGRNKRSRRTVCSVIVLVIIAALIGGIVGGVLASKKSSKGGSSAAAKNGELFDINSSQVQALLNNTALHRVFPGMDYTPLNAQYPECLTTPPDQNNITLDVAILSQLSPAIRLYGTDCNQTEMVLTAIDRLGYTDSLTVWLGVWLGNNDTTNDRQIDQMYSLLSSYPESRFAGIIVGNEVLYRKDMTNTSLSTTLSAVRANLTAQSITLPLATSDLGDDWTADLAADTDIVMANVHPFFAGVTPDVAPGWTWDFWQTHDVALTAAATPPANQTYPRNIIAETGWPSAGGNDCGSETTACPDAGSGAVASVANMNTFMDGWVCQALANGTSYFWFEAFDEPWKVIFNTALDQWESKWGLLDENRVVKDGLVIPDCGGKTLDRAY
nr:putative glucan endo-1,3-beta-glucosidase btgc [Quercus suber]